METSGNVELLNEGISEELRTKIFLFLCNSNLNNTSQRELMKMMNKSFNDGLRMNPDVKSYEDDEDYFSSHWFED